MSFDITDPDELAADRAVSSWLADKETYAELFMRGVEYARSSDLKEIAEHIANARSEATGTDISRRYIIDELCLALSKIEKLGSAKTKDTP